MGKKIMDYHVPDQRFPVIQQCEGCGHREGNFCKVYRFPSTRWSAGPCPMATHVKKAEEQKEKFLNPLKASKRKSRGK